MVQHKHQLRFSSGNSGHARHGDARGGVLLLLLLLLPHH
jgi:hypothetical protein